MSASLDEIDVLSIQARPTGSSLERAEACPISFSLPQITKAGIFAEHGTAIHAFVRALLIGMPPARALEAVPVDLRDRARGIDIRKITHGLATVRSEVSYAVDVERREVVELGVNIHRKYDAAARAKLGRPLRPYEVPLTVDVEGKLHDGQELAGDVKTGFKPLLATAMHRQVHLEVIARRLASDADVVAGRIWKVLESGDVLVDPHLFAPLELDEIADELFEIIHGVLVARKRFQEHELFDMNPGPWCEHCPAAPVCPARVALARAVLEQSGEIVSRLSRMTAEQEWEAWNQVKTGVALFEEIVDNLKPIVAQRYAQGAPVSAPDGSKYVKPIKVTKENFNQQMALSLLRHLGASEEQIAKLWTPFTFEQFRIVNTKGAKKVSAKLAAQAANASTKELIDTSFHGKALPPMKPAGGPASPNDVLGVAPPENNAREDAERDTKATGQRGLALEVTPRNPRARARRREEDS